VWPHTAAWDQDVPRAVTVEWDHETGTCVVPAHVVRGPHQETDVAAEHWRDTRQTG
jgi:hypothetical protein